MEIADGLIALLYKHKIVRCVDRIDYRFLLPSLYYLPVSISERLAQCRGLMRYALDVDWRSVAVGRPHIKRDTERALKFICGENAYGRNMLLKRFMHQSREEMEAIFYRGKENWPRKVVFENLESFQSVREQKKGLVLLSAHYDSSIAGITFLANEGFTVNIFFDDIVYDPQVPEYIRSFFRTKYRNIEKYLNGGIFISKKNLKDIYGRLSEGQTFIVVSDVLNRPQGIKVQFMKKECTAPYGALKIPLKTNSYLGAFITLWEGKGVYRTICAAPTLVSEAENPVEVVRGYYRFLTDMILTAPERWWASDKLLEFC
jgi:lauroyl/myristoyl acyltransferase